ncbi:MAG: hypothetical protein ACMG57_01245 [Candidatus Dojkabacteria bacterium]
MDKHLLNVVIFGAGGSGTSVQREILINPYIHVDIVTGVDDSGGSTRGVTKIIEIILKTLSLETLKEMGFDGRFLNRPDLVLPFGDIRNNLLRVANYSKNQALQDVAKLLNLRIPYNEESFETIRESLKKVFELLGVDEFTPHLDWYIQTFLNVFFYNQEAIIKDMNKESEKEVKALKDLCIGNLFLSYFYLTSDSQESFFEKLKQMSLIPENIDFHFLSEVRHVALATDELGNQHIFEHNIDEATLAMQPTSFYQSPVNSNGKPTTFYGKGNDLQYAILQPNEVQPKFEKIFENADVIFAATGSYANMFPQAKLFAELIKKSKGLLIYVSNFARTKNEVDPHIAIYWLYQILGKEFITLLVNEELSLELFIDRGLRESYMRQHKFFNAEDATLVFLQDNIQNSVFTNRIFPILNLVNNTDALVDKTNSESPKEFIDNGIKHEPKEIADITVFFGIMYRLMDIHDTDKEAKELLFNGMIQHLRLASFQNSELQEYVRFLREIATADISDEQKFNVLSEIQSFFDLEGINIIDYINDFRTNRLAEFKFQ